MTAAIAEFCLVIFLLWRSLEIAGVLRLPALLPRAASYGIVSRKKTLIR